MKKIALFLLIAFAAFACTQEKTASINGKITSPLAETVEVQIHYSGQTNTATLAEDGTFSMQIAVEKEYMASLKNGKLSVPLFLTPGAAINIELNVDELKNKNSSGTKITGEGSEATAFLYSLSHSGMKEGIMELLKMPVDTFTSKMNAAQKASNEAIAAYKNDHAPSAKFIQIAEMNQKVDFAQKYDYYINFHKRYAPNDDTPMPESFQAYIDEIPVDNYELCKELPAYKYYLAKHFNSKITEELAADTTLKPQTVAYTKKNIEAILALEVLQEIKDELGYRLISSYSYSPDSIQQVYKAHYKELIKQDKYIKSFEETVAAIEKTKPGAVAPAFNFPDIEGNMVSSESLKGKVIYIDVWATWCGPCKGEIPYLKEMEEALHAEDIAFVSISVDEDKAAWEKMVKEKELRGYQLHAKEAWSSSIVKDYGIRGIPRFIIIDKEGKIVEANATRPSNPETKDKLLKLAKS